MMTKLVKYITIAYLSATIGQPLHARLPDAVLPAAGTTLNVLVVLSAVIVLAAAAIFWLVLRLRRLSQALSLANDMLQRQDMKSETIIEALPVGVEIYSKEGVLLSINSRDCEIFGIAKEEIFRNKISITENPNLPDPVKEAFLHGEKIHANFPYDFTVVRNTGYYGTTRTTEVKRISCNGTPVLDRNGGILNYVYITDDITEQYNQEKRLEESIRLSDQAIRAADLVLWRYDTRTRLFSAYNEPVNNYDRDVKIDVETYLAWLHPDDRQDVLKNIALMNEGRKEPFEFDLRLRMPGKSEWQYCTISGTPFLLDEKGDIVEYTGFRRNNTQWKKLNDDLNKVNTQNELILNNVNSGLAYITTDYVVQWENISLCSASLSSEAYRKGQICYQSTYGRISPCEDCVMTRAIRSGLTEQKILELSGRIMEIFATPVQNENGETEGVVIRLDDITERQRIISELRVAKEKAVQSDKLKSAFLANMSHEIRTPLNAIVGFADLLTTTDDAEEKAEYNKIIATNNELLLRLINDILNLSKIEAGSLDRHPEDFNLSSYFDELCASIQQRITNPEVKLICDNPYSFCLVHLDKDRMAQVMLNYATNAIKYTPKGFIRMGYECGEEGIRIYVSDSGIGISDDKKHLVYQRFEKLDEFAQGTGLGLSICKALTEATGGHVGFESEEGVGSTFWSWLPTPVTLPEALQHRTEAQAEKTGKEEADESPQTENNAGRKNILVAEDIESNFKLVAAILHKEYDLTWAVNGAEAVEKARSGKFDLILMDMKMPLMNGLEATVLIREFDRSTPIVTLTAHAFDSDKEAAIAAGCNDYLVKPVNKPLLLEVVGKWI